MTSPTPTTCELAARESDGVRVLLLWHPREDAVTVSVEDARTGQGFEFAVARACALDAFYHPFAYPPRDDHLPFITARAHERDARRRYQAAIAAAIESLRHAEQRFDESSAAIDVHIQLALAAASLTASLVAVSARERRKPDAVEARFATAAVMPA